MKLDDVVVIEVVAVLVEVVIVEEGIRASDVVLLKSIETNGRVDNVIEDNNTVEDVWLLKLASSIEAEYME